MAGLNLSTHHKIGDWASICHPFVFLDFASNASKCKPWPLNGPFWNSVWLLVWFPSAATIKWLAWTFQPTMKLVVEPASAILLYSWIFLSMPPNASPGLSMGYFGTAWATCMISKCCHYKMAGLNLSTHYEVGDWASICHPIPWCQPWPFNGPFWNSVWLLVWFPSAATIKRLASTFQPHHEVGDWASAILLHSLMPAPGVSMGHFGIVCGYLYDFQVLPL